MCDPINKVFLFPVPAVEGGGESFGVKGEGIDENVDKRKLSTW